MSPFAADAERQSTELTFVIAHDRSASSLDAHGPQQKSRQMSALVGLVGAGCRCGGAARRSSFEAGHRRGRVAPRGTLVSLPAAAARAMFVFARLARFSGVG